MNPIVKSEIVNGETLELNVADGATIVALIENATGVVGIVNGDDTVTFTVGAGDIDDFGAAVGIPVNALGQVADAIHTAKGTFAAGASL